MWVVECSKCLVATHHPGWAIFTRAKQFEWIGHDVYCFCTIQSVEVHVLMATLERFKRDSLRLKMDVKPPGQEHPFCAVTDGLTEMREHKDSGLRLGISLSGTYQALWTDGSEREGQMWIKLLGKNACFKANRLVDWMDGDDLDSDVPRSRIWYPREY